MKKSEFKVGNSFRIKGFPKRFKIYKKQQDGNFSITGSGRSFYAEGTVIKAESKYLLSMERLIIRFRRKALETILIPFDDLEKIN